MTTLALLRARIVFDLERADLTEQIDQAIADAINFYQAERFYFNESRAETFDTVADQWDYTDASVTGFIRLDEVLATVDGRQRRLWSIDPVVMEELRNTNAMTGVPARWAYYNQSISIYPLPDDVYTIRMMGHLKIAAPASDDEANNEWMMEAFELIRSRAKVMIAAHILMDSNLAQSAAAMEASALDRLRRETSRRIGRGTILPTCW